MVARFFYICQCVRTRALSVWRSWLDFEYILSKWSTCRRHWWCGTIEFGCPAFWIFWDDDARRKGRGELVALMQFSKRPFLTDVQKRFFCFVFFFFLIRVVCVFWLLSHGVVFEWYSYRYIKNQLNYIGEHYASWSLRHH